MSSDPTLFARRILTVAAACLLAGCGGEMASTANSVDETAVAAAPRPAEPEPRIEPIPPIPAALRGCWETEGPEDPDEPGAPHRLIVTDTTIELVAEGMPRRIATAEFVERVSETSIEGRFSAAEGDSRATVATSLSLGDGGDGGPRDMLRRAEGDAGSDYYSRCPS